MVQFAPLDSLLSSEVNFIEAVRFPLVDARFRLTILDVFSLAPPPRCFRACRCAHTQKICFEMCVEDDTEYGFFGLQYGYECWCSKTFSESPGGQCDYPCSQNAAEMCGGFDEIFAYQIN